MSESTIEHDNVAGYVADALEPQEREEFESHMAGCEVCEREVRDFAETFAELTLATELTPPADLRESVLTAIAKVTPLPALESDERPAGDARPRRALSVVTEDDRATRPVRTSPATPAESRPEVAAVSRLDEVRARRIRRVLSLAVAAAMVIAVALGVSVVNLNQDAQRQQEVASAETELLAAPDAKVYPITMQDGSRASYVVSKAQNRALFIGANVAELPADQIYQLWTVPGENQFVSAATFSGSGQQRILVTGGVDDAAALGITIEPSNGGRGSVQPTLIPSGPDEQPFAVQPISA